VGRFGRFSNYLAKAEDGLALAAACLIGFMMVYTVASVISRGVRRPIMGATEYVTLIFVFVVMLAISFAQRRWEHLAMGVVFDRLAPGARRPILFVLLSLGIFICFLLTWSCFDTTVWAYRMGDQLLGALPIKTWWSRMSLPIGLGIATVRLVVQLVQLARGEMAL
jgi:TRAP-type C4-dicarboxylate transport system permease small subunit